MRRAMSCESVRFWALLVALAVAMCSVSVTVSAASVSGGMACNLDVQCGQPAANMQQMRETTASITGSCTDGVCVCAGGYSCENCYVNGPGEVSPRQSPFTPKINVCANPFGGGKCEQDSECFNGLCIAGKCVCWSGFTCEYCTLSYTNDILSHAKCGEYKTGGVECAVNADCVHGSCLGNKCVCSSGFVCSDCSASQSHVVAGVDSCSCSPNQCNGHGTCSKGECTCTDGYLGAACSIDPCKGVSCSGHGSCSAGQCSCTGGYTGDDCSIGGGECSTNADCGIWAPIEGAADPQRECANGICVEDKYGGTCQGGFCKCNAGFACSKCTAKGDTCDQATGGGECTTNADCGGNDQGGSGGFCWNGVCTCYAGFSCPYCDVVGTPGADGCPDRTQRRGGFECTVNEECGPSATQGTGGSCVEGKCSCFGGFYCPSCNHVGEPSKSDPCVEPTEGGQCFSNSDCVNGLCVKNKCSCYEGWTCPWCNKEELKPGDRIPGSCTSSIDCGYTVPCVADPSKDCYVGGGTCIEGLCQCYTGFVCSHCNAANVDGPTECPDDYVKEGDPLVCPDRPQRSGGKACTTVGDCGEQADGTYGGKCSAGHCECWTGYSCEDCSKKLSDLEAGATCAATTMVIGFFSLFLAAATVMFVSSSL